MGNKAKVAMKSRNHAVRNSYSLFNHRLTVDDVMNVPTIFPGLTRFMACPPTCGTAAAIVCSEDFARRHGISEAVEIVAQSMTTDTAEIYDNPMNLVGAEMTWRVAQQVYERAGIGPEDINVVELHDCFTLNEVITYEALGLCGNEEAEKFINNKDKTYGGKYVVKPSGDLMSKGHPLGATGLAQCTDLCLAITRTDGWTVK